MEQVVERNPALSIPPGMCSCGKTTDECRELGWPHEWNFSEDGCVLCGEGLEIDAQRYGSGYAHPDCIDPPPDIEPASVSEARDVHGFGGDDS